MQLEDLHLGAAVVSSDGHKLGKLHRFVVDREALTLTHIVVDTGLLRSGEALWKGGWGLSHDRVVPRGALAHADSDELRLTMTADEFKDLSVDYIEERFSQIPDREPGALDSSDLMRLARSIPGEPGAYVVTEVMATAANADDVKEDSPVWRLNPHEKIGEVERAVFDEASGKVSALVVRRGHFFAKDVLLPIEHVVEIVADIIRVDVDDAALKALREYHPED